MSVINQMLRDLDARQKDGRTAVSLDPAMRDIRRDTLSVDSIAPTNNRLAVSRRALVVLALVMVLALGGGWLLKERSANAVLAHAPARNELPTTAAQTAAVSPAERPAVVAASAPVVAPPKLDQVSETPTPNAPLQSAVRVKPGVAPALAAAPAGPASSASRDTPGPRMAAAPATPALSPTTVAAAAPREVVPVQPNRNQAVTEVMAQAQSLWNQGSRDAATQLLRDAAAVLERSAAAGESTALLSQVARELTRMELAQGHAAVAMDLLQRLEPLLANQADVWALRGNAAQRLGRHAESVQAYLTALKLRPGEARWMLGAAVSLAAQGQTAQASELAEQARQRGGLSPEVESYLRQQGVVLH